MNRLPTMPTRADFPADFRWGCATAAYQIEGAAAEDGRGESIWDRFCRTPGRIRDGSSGDVACDHYHRWAADLDLLKSLGANAYRFSIAWPRVFPQGRGRQPHGPGLDFYDRLVDGMLERGIEPWATLYHWDLPQALQDEGGWTVRPTADAFADYAHAVAQRLGDRVRRWITHNEPWCTAFLGHHEGVHAPGVKDFPAAMQVLHHLLVSHGMAARALRSASPGAQVGITLSLHPTLPAGPGDDAAVRRHDGLRNRWFLDPLHGRGYPADSWALLGAAVPQVQPGDLELIAAPTDFLGINYYFPEMVADAPGHGPAGVQLVPLPGVPRTAFGWPVWAEGLTRLLQRVHDDYAPREIHVTENGSTFEDLPGADGFCDDTERRAFLQDHLAAALAALRAGVPLKGYFAWSLLDNFEWAEGYLRRFGLAYVDYPSQRRTLKASGRWYAQFLHGAGA